MSNLDGRAFDRQLDLGVGYWIPSLLQRGLLEWVMVALDVKNITSDANFWTKVHAGAEAQLPLGAIRAGINQGYLTWGFDARFYMFNIEFSNYVQELGEYPGHIADRNYLLVFRIGF